MRDSYRLSLWKDIRKGWDKFTHRTNIRIGNGRRTRFWWDGWVGEIKLKDVYPTLFRLSSHKNATVADLRGRGGGGGGCWEVSFKRPFQDWEQEVSRFLEYISSSKVQEVEDTLICKNDGKGKYSVKSYYISLRAENNILFPAKEV